MKTLHLTKLYRQSDPIFGARLLRIRQGRQTRDDLNWIASRVRTEIPAGATVLALRHVTVNAINKAEVQKLRGEPFIFDAIRTGTYKKDKFGRNRFKDPYPERIGIRTGCRVIVKVNGKFVEDGMHIEYSNGEAGIFYGIDKKERLIVERLRDKQILYIKRHKVEDALDTKVPKKEVILDEEGNIVGEEDVAELVKEVKGSYSQYPITLGYAQTWSSCQGLTLDKVHVCLDKGAPFMLNGVYVVMSRVRTPEGLTFNRALTDDDIQVIPDLEPDKDQQQEMEI